MNVYALKTDEVAILDILEGLKRTYKRKYCFPAQNTIIRLLKENHAIRMSLSTLNRRLRRLEKLRFIKRIRRLSRKAFRSTVYYVCDRVGVTSGKIKKILGYAKRLASCYPRLSKLTNDMITTKSSFVRGGLKPPPAPQETQTKRCEPPDRSEKPAGEEPMGRDSWKNLGEFLKADWKRRLIQGS